MRWERAVLESARSGTSRATMDGMTNTTQMPTEEILAVALDAYLSGRDKEAAPLIAAVEAHATQAGIDDYLARAADVKRGYEDPTWAWPLTDASDAYLNAVGANEICEEIGFAPGTWRAVWEEIKDIWLGAFEAGYKAAHEAERG